VILGAVAADYIADGQATSSRDGSWPHGSIEIPAILLGGQAVSFSPERSSDGQRFAARPSRRAVVGDLLAISPALPVCWCGPHGGSLVSQYHQPVLPYGLKIAFGCVNWRRWPLSWVMGRE